MKILTFRNGRPTPLPWNFKIAGLGLDIKHFEAGVLNFNSVFHLRIESDYLIQEVPLMCLVRPNWGAESPDRVNLPYENPFGWRYSRKFQVITSELPEGHKMTFEVDNAVAGDEIDLLVYGIPISNKALLHEPKTYLRGFQFNRDGNNPTSDMFPFEEKINLLSFGFIYSETFEQMDQYAYIPGDLRGRLEIRGKTYRFCDDQFRPLTIYGDLFAMSRCRQQDFGIPRSPDSMEGFALEANESMQLNLGVPLDPELGQRLRFVGEYVKRESRGYGAKIPKK